MEAPADSRPAARIPVENPQPSTNKVLLTGGTGFVASHVLDCLLDHSFEVVVTARSREKGERIIQSVDNSLRRRVSYVVVEDIAQKGAFNKAVQADPPFEYVVHTASPYRLQWNDPYKDCLEPAINGTIGILESIQAHAPSVKRVVITSSSAAILSPPNHREMYDESCWSDVTWDQGLQNGRDTYRASKKFAESAAWSFMNRDGPNKPHFTLATINNSYTFGPVARSLTRLADINTSNHRIRDFVVAPARAMPPTAPVFTFVDVRDVALAHVRALTVPEAGGKRFYVVTGFFSNPRIASIVRRRFPELAGRLPIEREDEVGDDFPADHWAFDNRRSREVLGLEYRGLEESVVDTVRSVLELEEREKRGVEGRGR